MSKKKKPNKDSKKRTKQIDLDNQILLSESKKYEKQLKKEAKAEAKALAKVKRLRKKKGYIVNEEDIVRFDVDLKFGLTDEQVAPKRKRRTSQ